MRPPRAERATTRVSSSAELPARIPQPREGRRAAPIVGVRPSGSRAMEIEEERRGAGSPAWSRFRMSHRSSSRSASRESPDALLERAGGFPGAVAIDREQRLREERVDPPAFRVEEDGVLEVAAGMPASSRPRRKVRARPENPPGAEMAHVDPPGTGRSAIDRELPDRIRSRAAASDVGMVAAGSSSSSPKSFSRAVLAAASRGFGTRANSRHERRGSRGPAPGALPRHPGGRARARGGRSPSRLAPRRAAVPGLVRGRRPALSPGVVGRAAAPGFERRDAPVERRDVPERAPADPRLAQRAGHGARSGRVVAARRRART